MPVMDGLQLLSLIKRTHPAIPVVMFTGMATPENRAASLKNGAALFLDMIEVAGNSDAGVVIMHMLGEPATMQDEPHYDDVVHEVGGFLIAHAAHRLKRLVVLLYR